MMILRLFEKNSENGFFFTMMMIVMIDWLDCNWELTTWVESLSDTILTFPFIFSIVLIYLFLHWKPAQHAVDRIKRRVSKNHKEK